jgi:hypothetical protein
MSSLFSNDFEQLVQTDLLDLVEVRRVREYVCLDYKQETYPHNHSGKVDLLTDITAMANSRGGYLIIGVKEDDNAPDGTPESLLGIENGDEEASFIQSICISCIDEPISFLKIRDIRLDNGRDCIIIKIPDSPRKPHMVSHEKHRSFHVRHGRSNTTIGMQEVRNMVLSMTAYQSQLTSFLRERINANHLLAESKPFLLVMATPIYVDTDKLNPLNNIICDLLEKVPGRPDPHYDGILSGKPKPRIYGVETVQYGRTDYKPNCLRLFRNGHFEYYEDYSSFRKKDPTRPMPIFSYRISVTVLHFLNVAKQLYDLAELPDPLVISLVLGNVGPSFLYPWSRRPTFMDNIFIWKDKNLHVDISASSIENPAELTSQLLDRLFNAYGYEQNTHFDQGFQLKRQS